MTAEVTVAVGIVKNSCGEILLSQRQPEVYLGGQWEFPGGKLEPGETITEALTRELYEEISIKVTKARKLISLKHQYPKTRVNLQAFEVVAYQDQVLAAEGQNLKWVAPDKLNQTEVLAADLPIIKALNLPDRYLITPNNLGVKGLMHLIENAITKQNVRLIQYRDTSLSERQYQLIATELIGFARKFKVKLLLNAAFGLAQELGADGVHLNSTRLMSGAPPPTGFLLAASCHDAQELLQADKLKVDFVVLSQVLASKSHPETKAIGWSRFKKLLEESQLPTYALGGLGIKDITYARSLGAQGVAGIHCFL